MNPKLRRILRKLGYRERLLIHAGLHKTGSTSVQAALGDFRMLMPSRRQDFRSSDTFKTVILAADKRGLIVSSEHFLGELADIYSDARTKLIWLEECQVQAHLVVYMRPHLDWHESAYGQFLSEGRQQVNHEYLANVRQQVNFRYENLVRLLVSDAWEYSEVSIRYASDTVADFSRLSQISIRSASIQNMSLSPFGLVALRSLAQEGFASWQELRSSLVGYREETKRTHSLFSENQQKSLLAMRSDWEAVYRQLRTEDVDSWAQGFLRYEIPLRIQVPEELSTSDLDRARRYVDAQLSMPG